MNLRPAIERELRVASRQRTTYNNRIGPGILLCLISGIALYIYSQSPGIRMGGELFGLMATVMFCLVWLALPLATADCLSREKREDTLGLLLLTPLRPSELAVSKLFTSFWQGAMLVLTSVPVLAIPILLGGVTLLDVAQTTLSLLTALLGAVTVGLLASALCERRGRAWLLAFIFAALWLTVQFSIHCWLLWMVKGWLGGTIQQWIQHGSELEIIAMSIGYGWLAESGLGKVVQPGEFSPSLQTLAVSFVVLILNAGAAVGGILFSARRVARHAESRFLSARQERLQGTFTRERFAPKLLRRRRRQLLDRNPITWMQQRRWSHRLVKWGWLFTASLVVSLATLDRGWNFAANIILTSVWIGIFMLFSLVLVTASNLQTERDNGALELLLVTPLSPRHFTDSRIRGFWISFLPAAAIVLLTFWFFHLLHQQMHPWLYRQPAGFFWQYAPGLATTAFFLLVLVFTPAIGLCFSLNRPGLFAAVLNTLFFAVIIPWGLPVAIMLSGLLPYQLSSQPPPLRAFPFWMLVGFWLLMTAGFQVAAWRAARRKLTAPMPPLMPAWFRCCRLGWILPWVLPPACFFFFKLMPPERLDRIPHFELWLFSLWHLCAWMLCAFLGWRCRRALIGLLTRREFGQLAGN